MNRLIVAVLSLSLSGSLLALLLLAAGPLLRGRASRAFSYYIWLLVLLRLTAPLALPGFNAMDALFGRAGGDAAVSARPPAASPPPPAPAGPAVHPVAGGPAGQSAGAAAPEPGAAPAQPPGNIFSRAADFAAGNLVWIWLAGAAASFLWFAGAYACFSRRLRRSFARPDARDLVIFRGMRGRRPVRLALSDRVRTPLLIGVFRPVVVLPRLAYAANGMAGDLRNILLHELAHDRRRDILLKWLVIAVTSAHWFNPLMPVIRREIGKACELACDEAVIRTMGRGEMRSYGNTLLALAADGKMPDGILATTFCEEKRALKERLRSIMTYGKRPAWAAALTVSAALALAGCAVALGASAGNTAAAEQPVLAGVSSGAGTAAVQTPAPTAAAGVTPAASATPEPAKAAVADLDGDGAEDTVHLDYTDNAYANGEGNLHVGVTLSSGRTYEGNDFPGNWTKRDPLIADMDGDGRDDIVLVLEDRASNYGATDVYVLRVQDGARSVMSFGCDYIQNDTIRYAQPESFFGGDNPCVGASVVEAGGKNLLRMRHLIDKNENTAWYVDALWNGEGWLITDMNVGTAYGEDGILPQAAPAPPAAGEGLLPAFRREGYREAKLTFVKESGDKSVKDLIWAGDPDARGYDGGRGMETLSLREQAQAALQALYDMTGCRVESCYFGSLSSLGKGNVELSMDRDVFSRGFLSAVVDVCTGEVTQFTIAWKKQGTDSPYDPETCAKPGGAAAMSAADRARWYYGHSSFAGRRAVTDAREHKTPGGQVDLVTLVMAGGDFFELYFDCDTGLPDSLYGPYPEGFSH